MQANLAVIVDGRRDVLRAARIIDDFVTGEQGVVVTLGTDATAVVADVVGLMDGREQFEGAFRRKIRRNGAVIWNSVPCQLRVACRRLIYRLDAIMDFMP